MRPDRKLVSHLYKSCVVPFEELAKTKWVWDKGEKPRILQTYITYCEAAGVRDDSRIEEMVGDFIEEIQKRGKKWGQWAHANRSNYLGFVLKRDDIKIAGAKLNPENKAKAEDFAIAGTQDSEEWDF